MHLKQLQYTLEVAKCKSFSKAAKKLYVSQPSLSTSISSFEEELGLTLFLRTTSGVVLTQEGEQVLAQIEEVLTSVDRLAAMGKQGFVKYNTTLAAIPSACNGMVINLLGEVAQSNPEITLNILELRPQKVLQSLINGVTDIVIGSYTEETKKYIFKETQKNNLELEPLFEDYLYVFLQRNHPLAKKTSVSLKELAGERQAIFNDFLLLESAECAAEEEKNLSECYSFSDRSSIKQAVAAGLAYAVLPHQMVIDDIYATSGLIKALPINTDPMKIYNYVAYRKSNYMPKQEQVILEYIRTLAAEYKERLEKLSLPMTNNAAETTVLRY